MCLAVFCNGEVKFYSPVSLALVYLLSFSQVTIHVSTASVITVVRASQRVQRAR